MPKYFVSAIQPQSQLGSMQFEAPDIETAQQIAEQMCPEQAIFRLYVVEEFDEDFPPNEFITAKRMKEMGY